MWVLSFLFLIGIILLVLYSIQMPPKDTREPFDDAGSKNTICCIYAYYEKNKKYLDNFNYFLKNAILPNVDYYITINGECSIKDTLSKMSSVNPNIKIIYRENVGFDFGAYCYVINGVLPRPYDYYFFINTSVKGPYIKKQLWNSSSANTNANDWTTPFLQLFQPIDGNSEVKIVGTSINITAPTEYLIKQYGNKPVYPHVQSMFFCIDNEYLEFLKKKGFFKCMKINDMNMNELIANKEIGLSQLALQNGWNINCILSKYKNLDYRDIFVDFNTTSVSGDPYYKNAYFSTTIDPYEVIFFKNNRF